jgi:hypothetical protein
MLNEKQIDRINKLIGEKIYTYDGPFISPEIKSDIDFKFKVLGYRTMIRVGEPYPYIRVKLIITNTKDNISTFLFNKYKKLPKDELIKRFNDLYYFRRGIESEISRVLVFFDNENSNNIVFDDMEIESKEVVTEQKKTRLSTKTIVKDIINILKTNEEGHFSLPEDDFYEFTNYPFSFSVDLHIEHSDDMDDYIIDGAYYSDSDEIEITIVHNPKNLKKNFYGIIGELNEIITHELEHGLQKNRGEIENYQSSSRVTNLEYYLQPLEIEAQVKGFRRLSNLTKQPFEKLVRDWFDTHQDLHGLNKDEGEEVIDSLINYNKKWKTK